MGNCAIIKLGSCHCIYKCLVACKLYICLLYAIIYLGLYLTNISTSILQCLDQYKQPIYFADTDKSTN